MRQVEAQAHISKHPANLGTKCTPSLTVTGLHSTAGRFPFPAPLQTLPSDTIPFHPRSGHPTSSAFRILPPVTDTSTGSPGRASCQLAPCAPKPIPGPTVDTADQLNAAAASHPRSVLAWSLVPRPLRGPTLMCLLLQSLSSGLGRLVL